jgi:hypothetical protein
MSKRISREQERKFISQLFAKREKPYNVFLGKKIVNKVVNSKTVLSDFPVLVKYMFTKKLEALAGSIYLGKMGEAVLDLMPEKKSLAKKYFKISQDCLLDSILPK